MEKLLPHVLSMQNQQHDNLPSNTLEIDGKYFNKSTDSNPQPPVTTAEKRAVIRPPPGLTLSPTPEKPEKTVSHVSEQDNSSLSQEKKLSKITEISSDDKTSSYAVSRRSEKEILEVLDRESDDSSDDETKKNENNNIPTIDKRESKTQLLDTSTTSAGLVQESFKTATSAEEEDFVIRKRLSQVNAEKVKGTTDAEPVRSSFAPKAEVLVGECQRYSPFRVEYSSNVNANAEKLSPGLTPSNEPVLVTPSRNSDILKTAAAGGHMNNIVKNSIEKAARQLGTDPIQSPEVTKR